MIPNRARRARQREALNDVWEWVRRSVISACSTRMMGCSRRLPHPRRTSSAMVLCGVSSTARRVYKTKCLNHFRIFIFYGPIAHPIPNQSDDSQPPAPGCSTARYRLHVSQHPHAVSITRAAVRQGLSRPRQHPSHHALLSNLANRMPSRRSGSLEVDACDCYTLERAAHGDCLRTNRSSLRSNSRVPYVQYGMVPWSDSAGNGTVFVAIHHRHRILEPLSSGDV